MRLLFLLTVLGALAVTKCATDLSTAEWILSAICSNDTTTTNSGGDSVLRPPCKNQEKTAGNKEDNTKQTSQNFSLNPTNIDPTVDCTTKSGEPGTCVMYYQCNPETQTIIDDGASILDFRENVCPHYLEVCCKENEVENESPSRFNSDSETAQTVKPTTNLPTAQQVPTFAPISTQPPDSQASTVAPAKLAKSKKKGYSRFKPQFKGCGWSNPGANIRLRISEAGEPESPFANFGDFPWMVALLKKTDDSGVWSDGDSLGGGTLIHPSVVMTVAHKLTIPRSKRKWRPDQVTFASRYWGPDQRPDYQIQLIKSIPIDLLKCRAGEWDTQTTRELFPHQERDVSRYIIHSEFDRVSVLNDIALLIMKEPFQLEGAYHMGTGCLATSLPAPGADCYSMGWGRDFNKEDKALPSVLKKVKLNYVESDRCQSLLRRTRLGVLFELHDSLICANGEEGVDTCRGDGGSPLVCPVAVVKGVTRYAVYGIVAYGLTCGDPNIPAEYASVPHLKSWVDQKMQEEGFDTSEYTIS